MQLVAGDVEELEVGHAVQAALKVTILHSWLHKERLNSVFSQFQNFQTRQVAEAAQRAHLIVREVELAEVGALALIEHILEVAQLARGQVQIADVLEDTALQARCENLLCQAPGECLLSLLMLLIVDGEAVKDTQLSKMEDAVDAIVVAKLGAHQVAGDVQNDQALEILQLDRLLHVAYQVIAEIELHETLQVLESIKSRDLIVFK